MNYPIVIRKQKRSDYGVTVPDLPGCFSAGKTLDDALAMAREAIELHLEGADRRGDAGSGADDHRGQSEHSRLRGRYVGSGEH